MKINLDDGYICTYFLLDWMSCRKTKRLKLQKNYDNIYVHTRCLRNHNHTEYHCTSFPASAYEQDYLIDVSQYSYYTL